MSQSRTPIHYQSLVDVAAQIKAKKLSPVELAESQFSRIRELEPSLHAYATLMEESAKAEAKKAEREIVRGSYRGPLHGIPIAVKDLCYTKGVPTMGGSAALRDLVPEFDGTVVKRLREAGAVVLGKLNLTERPMSAYNPLFKDRVPYNPWDLSLSPGGSSSGSGVATAAGMCFASIGTDTGGSIRFPCACDGLSGIKPTWGRVSRHGVLDLAQSLDHVGPMTRTVADAAAVLQVIAGVDPDDPTALPAPVPDYGQGLDKGIKGIRVGFDDSYASENVHPETAAAIAAAVKELQRIGARIVKVKLPDMRPYLGAWIKICSTEALTAHATRFPSRASDYGPWFRSWLEQGYRVSGAEYARSTQLRLQLNGLMGKALEDVDVLVCPTMPTIEPRKTQYELFEQTSAEMWDPMRGRFTMPYNFSGVPTVILQSGQSKSGAPLSMQLVGKSLSEELLIRIGHSFQCETDHHRKHPPV